MIPVFGIAILPEPAQYLSGVVPLYWLLEALTVGITGGSGISIVEFLLVGIFTQGLVIGYILQMVNA